jgi:hypothetical protein
MQLSDELVSTLLDDQIGIHTSRCVFFNQGKYPLNEKRLSLALEIKCLYCLEIPYSWTGSFTDCPFFSSTGVIVSTKGGKVLFFTSRWQIYRP